MRFWVSKVFTDFWEACGPEKLHAGAVLAADSKPPDPPRALSRRTHCCFPWWCLLALQGPAFVPLGDPAGPSVGPGDLEQIGPELLKARVTRLGLHAQVNPQLNTLVKCPLLSLLPSEAHPLPQASNAPLEMHSGHGVNKTMAGILCQRSTQITCSRCLSAA